VDDCEIPEAVRAAWQHVTEAWDDAKRHDAFVGLAAQHECFPWAAARYKERAGDPVADRQIDRVQRAAAATLMATATRKPENAPKRYQVMLAVLAVIGIVLAVGLFYAMHLREHSSVPPPKAGAR
jgi:hypothetical protein